ncbi:(E)-4-hydroxy-3-methylbut-2-enyl-diphosphate synthase [Rubellicoccus peritrichatus]|uniref:4-hydroxy-3-methylbut-2-en-1-yl diphosphate synthase (flavodoxin) n=1 Tax=Rubellicoccus peritrichatus TaxID=3080537 RepID=A0AAQ3L8B6_9BACT|nr:(E)-4-hydroxy-3-methylbut-2-enyl-diphosphate synthase [Puniceicoccus sp. CR14]WOO41519.1 (E)-4-hydroxy-3-methylbut-2-enyl-diphosphate synthase [Puniceicoccus sp. CR14]
MKLYCESRFVSKRRKTSEVKVGNVGVGGNNPIRVQSMTTSLTQDVDATVKQCIRLAEAGCEVVRVTAPNKAAAQALKDIRANFSAAGFSNTPLVADIHFLPSAAMVAIEHVEKVRVNPGNYADKKKFAVKEYSDSEYDSELQRLHEAFSPLVKRAKELGRALRIGTNHGSLSDRLMNRYGDSPLGMVESALEFIRIAEDHNFHNIVLSMKSSNTKVMIAAYRLVVAKMLEENMHYPLHLGVTEAGDGEDARIKSAIGIGGLLYDGLGDTIRVSLTEDPWHEVPVASDLARRAETLWASNESLAPQYPREESVDPYDYRHRNIVDISFGPETPINPLEPPRVITRVSDSLATGAETIIRKVREANEQLKDARLEGLMLKLDSKESIQGFNQVAIGLSKEVKAFVLEIADNLEPKDLDDLSGLSDPKGPRLVILPKLTADDSDRLKAWGEFSKSHQALLAVDLPAMAVERQADVLKAIGPEHLIFTTSSSSTGVAANDTHPVGAYRALVNSLDHLGLNAPLWIRCVPEFSIKNEEGFGRALLEASMQVGNIFCDGAGDLISAENFDDPVRATNLAYNILQGARMRTVKTEYVACPSCGRTLFDLQEVTSRIKERTGHLKGVTIAVMGCIVNGPGEMADADFGYVGGAPAKINLYVGKECVQVNIPEEEALDRLVDLITEHGKWVEPAEEPVGV